MPKFQLNKDRWSLTAILLLWSLSHLCVRTEVKAGMVKSDSLQGVLASAVSDTQRARLSYEIGQALFQTNLDSSAFFFNEAVEILEARPDTHPSTSYYRKLVGSLNYAGKQDRAIEVGNRALETGEIHQDVDMQAQMYCVLVAVYSYKGDFKRGMEVAHEGIAFLKAEKDTLNLGQIYLNLGFLYQEMEDQEGALEYFTLAEKMSLIAKDTTNRHMALSNLGASYYSLKMYDKALAIQHMSWELAKASPDSTTWIYPLVNLGGNYLQRKQLEKAREYYDLALQIARTQSIPNFSMVALLGMSDYHLEKGNLEEAEGLLVEALDLGRTKGGTGMMEYVYESMVEMATEREEFETALNWQTKRMMLKDSLLNSETLSQVNGLKVKYDLERKEQENNALRLAQENADTRSKLVYSIGGILATLVVLVLLFLLMANRRKERFNKKLSAQQKLIEAKNKMLEEQNTSLEDLNQEKDALMAIVAHDLKAPLIKAEGLGHLVETEEGLSEKGREALAMMQETFMGARTLVGEIVLLSQLESNSIEVELEPLNIGDLVVESVDSFQPLAQKKNIDLQLKVEASGLEANAYPDYFKRIMDNLLSNAIKFSKPDTKVKVKAENQGEQVVISIKDHGPGIPPEDLPKLFQKFNRLSNRPTGGESSTGLGLSIVKQLVNSLQGTVDVESEVGKGSTFWVKLPST